MLNWKFSVAVGAIAAICGSARAASIGVNFVGNGVSLAPTDVAGLVPQANYTNLSGASGTVNSLVDSNGVATSVNIAYSASGTFDAHSESNTDQFTNATDNALMDGYLDNFGGTTGNITFSGLTAGQPYDVIVYDLESTTGRGGAITVTGAGTPVTLSHTAAVSTNYVAGTNYSDFGLITPDANGDIVITTDGSSFRIAEQGVQLIPSATTPLPASALGGLVLLGGLAVMRLRRRMA